MLVLWPTCPHVPVSTFRSLFSAAASPLAHHGAGHGAHHHRHDGAAHRLLLRAPNHSTSPPHPPHGTARFLFRLTDIISRCARSKLQRCWSPFYLDPQSVQPGKPFLMTILKLDRKFRKWNRQDDFCQHVNMLQLSSNYLCIPVALWACSLGCSAEAFSFRF